MFLVLLIVLSADKVFGNECASRKTQFGIMCVCNSTYCDRLPLTDHLEEGTFKIYSTSRANPGFREEEGKLFSGRCSGNVILNISKRTRQTILGFGGAFTDSCGINIKSLPLPAQQKLIESYFSNHGNAYSLCRVPIGGTDYSTRPYSYDDTFGDVTLKEFKLQPEDYNYKVRIQFN